MPKLTSEEQRKVNEIVVRAIVDNPGADVEMLFPLVSSEVDKVLGGEEAIVLYDPQALKEIIRKKAEEINARRV